MLNQMHMFRRFADHANGLIMTLMPDVDDFVAFFDETQHLTMHLAHQRACGVNNMHAPSRSLSLHRRRHAVRREDNRNSCGSRGIGNLSQFLHEYCTLSRQFFDNMLVVHNLTTHIHRRQIVSPRWIGSLENRLHSQNRPVDARAKATGIRQYDALGHDGRLSLLCENLINTKTWAARRRNSIVIRHKTGKLWC